MDLDGILMCLVVLTGSVSAFAWYLILTEKED
jgi:hypothetical protein